MPKRTRILVIDDDKELCWLIQQYLEPIGYEVVAVHQGPLGLDRATSEAFDAILLDVMLPGMDGFEVLKRIRAKTTTPHFDAYCARRGGRPHCRP